MNTVRKKYQILNQMYNYLFADGCNHTPEEIETFLEAMAGYGADTTGDTNIFDEPCVSANEYMVMAYHMFVEELIDILEK